MFFVPPARLSSLPGEFILFVFTFSSLSSCSHCLLSIDHTLLFCHYNISLPTSVLFGQLYKYRFLLTLLFTLSLQHFSFLRCSCLTGKFRFLLKLLFLPSLQKLSSPPGVIIASSGGSSFYPSCYSLRHYKVFLTRCSRFLAGRFIVFCTPCCSSRHCQSSPLHQVIILHAR